MLMPGPGVMPLHCIFRTENLNFCYIRPNNLGRVNGKIVIPEVYVNGLLITDEVPLQDNDIVQVGASRFLLIRVPVRKMDLKAGVAKEEKLSLLTAWERGMVRGFGVQLRDSIALSEGSRRHVSHMNINRELNAVMKTADRVPLSKIESYFAPDDLVNSVYTSIHPNDKAYLCSFVGAAQLANHWSSTMRRYLKLKFQLSPVVTTDKEHKGRIVILDSHGVAASTAATAMANHGKKAKEALYDDDGDLIEDEDDVEVDAGPVGGRRKGIRLKGMENVAEGSAEERFFSASILCEAADPTGTGPPGKFNWSSCMFIDRLGLMKNMSCHFDSPWTARDSTWLDVLYGTSMDPFNDSQEDELIGVGYLYLDGVQYLTDIDDTIALVSLEGKRVGNLKIKGRSWIDKIETAPSYLTVDSEKSLNMFEGKNCILRIYFESLTDLPKNHCSSTYVRFNFFYHNNSYVTVRHGGASVHPYIHDAIRIEQKITGDFLEYVKRGSIELEVYGKRKPLETRHSAISTTLKKNYITGESIPEEEEKDGEVEDEKKEGAGEGEGEQVDFEEMIRDLNANVAKLQHVVNTNKKVIENITAEKDKTDDKLKKSEAIRLEMEDHLPAKVKERYSSKKDKSGRSVKDKNKDKNNEGSEVCVVC